ncbi:MAG TPA: hypothetical protein VFD95_09200, partial [Usitatibacter sp.]|nr:hypothetical protein [Usitatibacter sp.]
MILRLLAVAALVAATAAQAQPAMRGEPALTPAPGPAPLLRLAPAQPKTRATLPPVSAAEVASVRAANEERTTKGEIRRRVVGVVREQAPAVLATARELRWSAVGGGQAAQFAVTSPQAGSMRLAIDLAGVPGEVEMVFFGSADPARLEGPVKVADIRDRTTSWWSPLTEGDTQTVEFFVPGVQDASKLALRVMRASHLFSTISSGFTKQLADIGSSGSCNVDLACSTLNNSAEFRNTASSVAQMVFNDGDYTVLCTGTLLADGDASSQVPWFYSANHCFDENSAPFRLPGQIQAIANTLTTLWDFAASSCNSQSPRSTWSQLHGGATYIYNNPESDVLMLRLNNAPPAGAYFAGW